MGNCDGNKKHSYMPEEGYVPNQETAVKIATAVLLPIYGDDTINREKPFNVELKDGVWYIWGTMPAESLGGVSEIEISKKDGCILKVSHGK